MNTNKFEIDLELGQTSIDDKVVLITGGTGSFGNAFVDYLLEHFSPKKIVIFSRDEDKQHKMAQRLSIHPKFGCMRFFIGDVRDRERLRQALKGVNYLVHAAALKHVPIAEYNPFEFVRTNIHGAENIVQASILEGVEKVVALSTDKACCPINLYGATKLASDKIFVAANNLSGGISTFSVVRYGNVIGSRGSVVPFFANLVRQGVNEIPITDQRMTRFWITLEDGVKFVILSLLDMKGGEIFIPKLPSANILDLANAIAPNKKIKLVGIRPGEKLHEQMVTNDDARNTCEQINRYIIFPWKDPWNGANYIDYKSNLVPEDFEYSSNKNSDWLTHEQLTILLKAYL